MAVITSAPTLPQVEGILRSTLTKRILLETGLGDYGICTATAGGSATTYFDDTNRLKSTQFNAKQWVGGWARISYDAGGAAAAPENELGPITTYDPTTNGRITFNPAMTAAPAVGDWYELWTNPDPKRVLDIIDKVLTEDIYLPCWSVLTECPDGDMEQNNTTDWTASNATVTKATAEPTMFGKRYLSVLATAANGYARSALLRGEPNTRYHVSAVVRCNAASTTAKLIAHDETNDVAIDSVTTTRLYNHRLYLEFTLPATCYTFSIRLSTVENAKTTLWDEVALYPLGATDIRLPWWVKEKNQKLGIFKMIPASIGDGCWEANLRGEIDKSWDVQDRYAGGGQLRIQQRYGLGTGMSTPLFIYGIRNEEAYANDNTDKKFVDSNLLVAWVCWKLFEWMARRPASGQQNIGWVLAVRDEYKQKALQLQYQQMEDIHRVMESPEGKILINDELSTLRYR